jgi:hypothetical protein
MKMSRREFLVLSSKVSGAGLTLSSLSAFANNDQPISLAKKPLTEKQRNIITAVVDHIFPATELPGAIDAGTDAFVIMMRKQWLNESEIELFDEGMLELDALSMQYYRQDFLDVEHRQQLKILEILEDKYEDHPWYALGSSASHGRTFVESPPFICQIKELSTHGFFMSEVGSTEVLRPFIMGKLIVDIPLDPNDSSWAYTPLV